MSQLLKAAENYSAPGTDTPHEVQIETPGSLLSSPNLESSTAFLIDGDTLTDTTGSKYRLAGAYAPETTKVLGAEGPLQIGGVDIPLTAGRRQDEIKVGEAGGVEVTDAVNQFMKRAADEGYAYDRVIKTGDTSQDRDIIRMTNSQGKDLVTELYRHGIYKPGPSTEQKYVDAYRAGDVHRQLGTFEGYQEITESLDNALLQNQLKDPTTDLPIYSAVAFDEAELAASRDGQFYNQSRNIAFDDPDRTIDNMATNSVGAAAYAGWEGLVAGAYGAAEMFGNTVGSEGFEQWGKDGVQFQEELLANLPEINNFHWQDVDGVWDGVQYMVNNTAASAAYLGLAASGALLAIPAAAAVGAAGAGAAVAGGAAFVAGAVPSATVYSGQIWNDMEDGEKDAGWAVAGGIAAGTLDRLGISAIFKPTQLINKNGRKAIADWLVQTGKATDEAAANALINSNQKAVAGEFFKHMGETASEQAKAFVTRQGLVRQAAGGMLRGALGEGLTEAGQETIQYVAAAKMQGDQINQWELEDRIRDALIAGSSIGAGFGGAGGVSDYASQEATIKDFANAEINRLNEIDQINRTLRERGETVNTVEEIIEETAKATQEPEYTEELRIEDIEKKRKGKKKQSKLGSFADLSSSWQREGRGVINSIKKIESIPDAIAKTISGANKLVAAASTTAFSPQELAKYATLRDIRALVGQTRGTINSGASFEASQDFIYSKLAQQVYMPQIMSMFGLSTSATDKDRQAVSGMLRKFASEGWYDRMRRQEDISDMPADLRDKAEALFQTAQRLEKMADNMWEEQDAAIKQDGGEGLGRIDGWWWRHRGFDGAKVQKNKKAWYEFMREHSPELTEVELDQFYDRITSGEVSTMDDYFSHVRGIEYQPGHHKQRSANLSEREGFDMFGQDDMFAGMDQAAKAAARYATNRRYFGAGGKKLDYLFDKLIEEGMPLERAKEVAWYTKAIIDSSTGNFNRISNPRWAAAQKFATTWSILAGLPLAALSSLPESVFIQIGLDKQEQSKALSQAGFQFAKKFYESLGSVMKDSVANNLLIPTDINGNSVPVPHEQQLLNDAGLFWAPNSAAKRLGVGETNIAYSWHQDQFFRYTGITNVTQAQRRAAASIFTDFMANRLAELAAAGDLNQNLTNRQQHVYQQLSELGINIEQMVELWKDFGNEDKLLDYTGEQRNIPDDVKAIINENMQLGMYNFVNMRIQNPGAANRPLFFQDPHYALLTQFNGFVSTFTANIVPKLWNDYVKNGTPQMKYETFKLMLMMMAMGGASQYLKDLIKYGKASPYLDNPQALQRAIYSSGVLGQYERIADQIVPLYGDSGYHSSIIDTAVHMVLGESGPTVRNVGSLTAAALELTDEETRGRGLEKIIKSTAPTAAILNPFAGLGGMFLAQRGPLRKGFVETLTGGSFEEGADYYDDL